MLIVLQLRNLMMMMMMMVVVMMMVMMMMMIRFVIDLECVDPITNLK